MHGSQTLDDLKVKKTLMISNVVNPCETFKLKHEKYNNDGEKTCPTNQIGV